MDPREEMLNKQDVNPDVLVESACKSAEMEVKFCECCREESMHVDGV